MLRELNAVIEAGTDRDVIWARQATGALLALKQVAGEDRAAGHAQVSAKVLGEHSRWFREAAAASSP